MVGCRWIVCLLLCALLGACSSGGRRTSEPRPAPPAGEPRPPVATPGAQSGATPSTPGSARRGAYYQDDGPGDNLPPNLEATPDAVPTDDPPLRSAANRPYVVFGKTYSPLTSVAAFRQRGTGSWYGRKFHGQKTSSGEPYDMYGMTAAHPTLPLPSYVRVTNVGNGRSVVVKVNDRGPFHSDRIIDLSYTAALKLGYVAQGSALVEIERVRPGDAGSRGALAMPASTPAGKPAAPVVAAAPGEPRVTRDSRLHNAPAAADVAPAPAATAVLLTTSQPDGVYLQLGAFGARAGAEEFRIKTYQQLPWLVETMYIVLRDQIHRVQLGPFTDRAAAQSVADRIRDALQLKPVFVLK